VLVNRAQWDESEEARTVALSRLTDASGLRQIIYGTAPEAIRAAARARLTAVEGTDAAATASDEGERAQPSSGDADVARDSAASPGTRRRRRRRRRPT